MGVFVMSTLSSLHVILFLNDLVTPTLWDLINFWMMIPFYLPISLPLYNESPQNSVELSLSEEAQRFERYALVPYLIIAYNYK